MLPELLPRHRLRSPKRGLDSNEAYDLENYVAFLHQKVLGEKNRFFTVKFRETTIRDFFQGTTAFISNDTKES